MKTSHTGMLTGNKADTACVLWASAQFDTAEIAELLNVKEGAVYRTLHMARDGAREDRRTA